MRRPNRTSQANSAPLEELLAVLLRQLRRPLSAQEFAFTDADAGRIASAVVKREQPDAQTTAARDALMKVVEESEAVLQQWHLTFEQSMETGMDRIPGWHSTAEFIDVANEKSNAEIRIAAGAVLVTALGDLRYLPYVLYLAARDEEDIDSVAARRVLASRSGIEPSEPDWLARVRDWYARQGPADEQADRPSAG